MGDLNPSLKDEDLAADGLVQFPTVIGGVVPVVNIAGVQPGQLKLTGQLLGDIYLGVKNLVRKQWEQVRDGAGKAVAFR